MTPSPSIPRWKFRPASTKDRIEARDHLPGFRALVHQHQGIADHVVYDALAAVFAEQGLKDMVTAHKAAKNMSIETGIDGVSVPLHSGAVKFWEEHGLSGSFGKTQVNASPIRARPVRAPVRFRESVRRKVSLQRNRATTTRRRARRLAILRPCSRTRLKRTFSMELLRQTSAYPLSPSWSDRCPKTLRQERTRA